MDFLHGAAKRAGADMIGFSDMSVEEIAADYGLPLFQARLAKRREYDEPFRIVRGGEGKRHRLFKALQAAHLGCVNEGGTSGRALRSIPVLAPTGFGLGIT